MIGYFPEPYQDELLYSVIARYAERMRPPTDAGLMRTLFGRMHAVAIADLPHGLATLVNNLPPGHPTTVNGLIDQHSLLPYYGPFLQPKTYSEIREAMEGSKDHSARVRCGISTSRVRPPRYFRSCPACDAENKELYGETFWNRLFQLKGVELCAKHQVFLESSSLCLSPLPNRHQFVSAEFSARKTVATLVDPNDRTHQILLRLAQDATWLFRQHRLNPGLKVIHDRYIKILRVRGFITTKGNSIRMADLAREVEVFVTPKLLTLLDCSIAHTTTTGWVGQLLHKAETASAPLRHLLLMQFLGVAPMEILCPYQSPAAILHRHETDNIWWCLNQICAHFRKPVITDFSREYMKKRKVVAAILKCPHCHFTYGLYDWSKPVEQYDFVRDYGPQWRERLKSSWLDTSVSVLRIAKLLAVDSKTVKSQALKLALQFPRQGKRKATVSGIYIRKPLHSKYTPDLQRQKWLRLLHANSNLCTTAIRNQSPALFTWLYRHDRKWLAANQAPPQKAKPTRSRVDWALRDQEIAGQAATAALQIKNRSQKLEQVTATAIGRSIGRQSLLEKHLDKLPLTRMIVQSYVESAEDFAVRRVSHVAARLRLQFGVFERWQLVKEAGLRPATEKLPKVQDALNYESIHTLTA